MKETKINKMIEERNMKALGWMMRCRVTGEYCSFRVTRKGFLEAVTCTVK